MFTAKEWNDEARFSDVHRAVELIATEQQNLANALITPCLRGYAHC